MNNDNLKAKDYPYYTVKVNAKLERKIKSVQNSFIKAVNKKLYPYKGAREEAIDKITRKSWEL